jgi:type I restriction enzyme M protein
MQNTNRTKASSITVANLPQLLTLLDFQSENEQWWKYYEDFDCEITVDFNKARIFYPPELTVNGQQVTNFGQAENFVVLECVDRLIEKGYRPEDIELEKRWTLGHEQKGGRADICVYGHGSNEVFLILECKTMGAEYQKALKKLQSDGGQLFSYRQQEGSVEWISLYASGMDESNIVYSNDTIACFDDPHIIELAESDRTIRLYKNAKNSVELYNVWKETYAKKLWPGIIFNKDTTAYRIGIKPLIKSDLQDFTHDNQIVNRFEEILRHNNVSDKENAFNRLAVLFICKLVDEIEKADDAEVDFQYKQGTDTYEALQDRLQRLYRDGMEKFMKEEIAYIPATYPDDLFKDYTGEKRTNAIDDLKKAFKILKYYSNASFSFKEVHNHGLFLQNGKLLVEMVQLFERYRIVYKSRHQFLGDMFEQLLHQGFRQNEGQFFTPTPITRFIWDCLPLQNVIERADGSTYPRIIDYACGAGHFLTEAVEAVNSVTSSEVNDWVEGRVVGVEKDYRLARVAKISLFMNGAGDGTIVYGDGLDNHPGQDVKNEGYDILVANPPYSVRAFKSHLDLRHNSLELAETISQDGGEIEVLFIERAKQLLKPGGVAAVILPVGVLNSDINSASAARDLILNNFYIRAIVKMGPNTFGETGTNTAILFLEKFQEPPVRCGLVRDSVDAILEGRQLEDWHDLDVYSSYLAEIGVEHEEYLEFIERRGTIEKWAESVYFGEYVKEFRQSSEFLTRSKRKSFIGSSPKSQERLVSGWFFDFVRIVEERKLQHFALTYEQATTVVVAPDGVKEQRKFLGYSWSKRKGQQGIKISKPGGELYCEPDRLARGTLASVIRDSFIENDKDSFQLVESQAAINRVKTSELLDFTSSKYSNSLSLVAHASIEVKSDFDVVALDELVWFNLGAIDPRSDPEKRFVYVDVASVEKATGIVDFSNIIIGAEAPSRARRTAGEGDILVATVRPSLRGFALLGPFPESDTVFSTGFSVLRVKDSNHMSPRFLYELFKSSEVILDQLIAKAGKGQYPSINSRDLSSVRIPVPAPEVQSRCLERIDEIQQEYAVSRMTMSAYREKVESVFREFGIFAGV